MGGNINDDCVLEKHGQLKDFELAQANIFVTIVVIFGIVAFVDIVTGSFRHFLWLVFSRMSIIN